MKLLEMFSGTGSVGTVAKDMGWDVVSLDLKGADINCDILQWKYKKYPVKYFDFVFSSPPAFKYNRVNTNDVRKIDETNKIVLKILEVINYFKPQVFVIQNPQSSLLKEQEFMKKLPYYDLDFCKYGFEYRRRTRLWTNLEGWQPRALCKRDCGNVIENKHIEKGQRLPSNEIPEALVQEMFSAIYKCCVF